MSSRDWASLVPLTLVLALLGGCVGATLPPLPPGAVEAEQEKQRELAFEDNERQQDSTEALVQDSSAAGYRSPAEQAGPSGPMGAGVRRIGWADLLAGNLALRRAADDVRRLRILDDVLEVRAGLLSAMVGPGFGGASTEYNLARLLAAYRGTVDWDPNASLILWNGDRKIGSVTGSSLTVFSDR